MLEGFAMLLMFQLMGELIGAALRLPVSGPIIGMVLLLIWLRRHARIDDSLGSAADGLLANMAVLFVPVGVGAMAYPELFREHWLFLIVAVTAGTAVTIVTTALTAKIMVKSRTPIVRQI